MGVKRFSQHACYSSRFWYHAVGLVAPAIAAGLGALVHTLGTLVPVIGASGFAAVATTIGIDTNMPVSNISLEESDLRIMNFISRDCYDWSSTSLKSNFYAPLIMAKFSISSDGRSPRGPSPWARPPSQKVSAKSIFLLIASTSIKMYWTSTPAAMPLLLKMVRLISPQSTFKILNQKSCRWCLIGGIGDETCEGAKTNTTSFACGNNIACYDFEDVVGYFYKRLSSYKGNLYLLDGCRGSYTVHYLYL
ncbi:hypothetical protein TEA_023579 [Camellia sinensis var. sinensis]|uniref:Uncharacterized protein n=1 Tax=Camellia sinensis var. sinensis TaxID=542762 RepID=A0A4S4E248_CAMSN|nr:hypothetical protein TEA_023579 [Camellia sinensis var. sinensis]